MVIRILEWFKKLRKVLIIDREGEGIELKRIDNGLGLLRKIIKIIWNIGERRNIKEELINKKKDVMDFKSKVKKRIGEVDIVRKKLVKKRGKMSVRRKIDNVRRMEERIDEEVVRKMNGGGGISVMGDDIKEMINKRIGGIGLIERIEKGIEKD